jgi:hypothetical protein
LQNAMQTLRPHAERADDALPEINSEGGGTEMRPLKDYSLAKMINL